MALETFYTKTATINRLSYTGDVSSFSAVGTAKGYLRPLSETQASDNGFQFGQAFMFQVPVSVDIIEGDTLTIDGQIFNIKGVAIHDRFSIAHKRCLLTLPEKG